LETEAAAPPPELGIQGSFDGWQDLGIEGASDDRKENTMLGDVIELSVVVRDLDTAIETFTKQFGLKVHHRGESKEFGFVNAILPTGIGHIELLQPTDPTKAVGRFLEKHGEGVYLVGFETKDIPGAVKSLKAQGLRVDHPQPDIAWVHPRHAHGLFVEMRKREAYG
jgi:methylmalonyl-CoA/ethylmalonyl-CoA epimerase